MYSKIEGEDAVKLASVEAEMEALSTRAEKEYAMLSEKLKIILYPILGLTREDGDKKMWTLVAKYFPTLGFYIAEVDDNPLSSIVGETPLFPTRPTIN